MHATHYKICYLSRFQDFKYSISLHKITNFIIGYKKTYFIIHFCSFMLVKAKIYNFNILVVISVSGFWENKFAAFKLLTDRQHLYVCRARLEYLIYNMLKFVCRLKVWTYIFIQINIDMSCIGYVNKDV